MHHQLQPYMCNHHLLQDADEVTCNFCSTGSPLHPVHEADSLCLMSILSLPGSPLGVQRVAPLLHVLCFIEAQLLQIELLISSGAFSGAHHNNI